ncbi:hypothetical protein GEMMAAP_13180 [Gemmatimonas phototrophica]|uniref:Uncharacterized protein n=1 Tax=Gemmatimonas phototrophica TaxID=1379270 RepID=A0A143BLW4_9BACT|nr:hypothetical protein GEMMAAP_13180 [Gemmatimonas phototrophica]
MAVGLVEAQPNSRAVSAVVTSSDHWDEALFGVIVVVIVRSSIGLMGPPSLQFRWRRLADLLVIPPHLALAIYFRTMRYETECRVAPVACQE